MFGSMFYNYKRYFSLILLGICDTNYRFISIDVGAYGKCSDSTVFKNSAFYEKLVTGKFNIPPKCSVSTTDPKLITHVLVGDEAFPLSENLMRPYPGNNLNSHKRIYNYRLSRARRYIECCFGILTNKWRIFQRPLDVEYDFAVDIVKAYCILHNFVRERNGYTFEDTLYSLSLIHICVCVLACVLFY